MEVKYELERGSGIASRVSWETMKWESIQWKYKDRSNRMDGSWFLWIEWNLFKNLNCDYKCITVSFIDNVPNNIIEWL